MKAVVLTKPKRLKLIDIPKPALTEENHVLVKVYACGICGSDLRYWAGENPWSLHTLGRHIDNPTNMVLGHEFAGEVVKVNSKKYASLIGKKFGIQSYRVCQKCKFCRTGRQNLCRSMIHIGHAQGWGNMEFYPGAYAEYCLGWADLLHPISPKVSFAEAAMADIVCVAVHAFGRTAIYEGSNIFCIGGGPLGLGIAIVAKASGAGEVFVSDPSPIARNVISQYPDLTPLDPTEVDVKRFITENVSHPQCAAIFDSVGTEETMKLAIPLLEEGGTYVNLAIHSAPLNIDALCLGSERTITTSSNAFYSDLEKSFEMLNSGVIDVLPWITHRFPLEGFADAFEKLLSSPKMGYKVVFEPFKDSYRREDRR